MTQIKLPLVMLVDDEVAVLDALERDLRGRFQIIKCQGLVEAIRVLEGHPDIKIVLTDEKLGTQEFGIDLLRWIQEHRPLIVRCMISGQMDPEEITQTLGTGVYHRFFFKPWDPKSLQVHLKECLVLAEFLKDSRVDSLTGLFNRRGFEEQLSREIERCQRHNRQLNLLLIDLDNFKALNDLSGHQAGDEHLKAFSEVLKKSLRNIDYVCRLGGDEFAIILPDTTKKDAEYAVKRLWNTLPPNFSASGGLAELSDHKESLANLVGRADAALYQAKRQGRSQVQVAD